MRCIYGISAAGALVKHFNENCQFRLATFQNYLQLLMKALWFLILLLSKTWKSLIRLIHKVFTDTVRFYDMTETFGGRPIRKNLISPLYNIKAINTRLDTVEAFVENPEILNNVRTDLKKVSDIQKILGKLNKTKASPKDLYALAETLEFIPKWQSAFQVLNNKNLLEFSKTFLDTSKLFKKIKYYVSRYSFLYIRWKCH